MIRLAISGVEGPALQALAGRLRGAAVDPPGERDAAVVLDHSADAIALAEMFLRAGKGVLLSAAACSSVELLDRLNSASAGSGLLAVLNAERYSPSRRLIKEQIDAGKLGAPGLVRIHDWQFSPAAGAVADPQSWNCDLDLTAWLIGARPERVYAVASTDHEYVQVHAAFPGAAMALIDRACVGNGYRSLSVIGSCGAAYADDHQNLQMHFYSSTRAVRADEGLAGAAAMVQDFVNGLQSRCDFSATAASWRSTLSAARAVRKSLETRQAILLEDA